MYIYVNTNIRKQTTTPIYIYIYIYVNTNIRKQTTTPIYIYILYIYIIYIYILPSHKAEALADQIYNRV